MGGQSRAPHAGSERAHRWLLVASAWTSIAVLPLATGSNSGRAAAMLLVAAGWLAAYAAGMIGANRVSGHLGTAIVTLAAVVFVSAAVSPYPGQALTWGTVGYWGMPMWIAGLVMFAGAAGTVVRDGDRRIVAAAVGWIALALVVALADVTAGRPVASAFNTPNTAAVPLVAAVPLCLWLAESASSTKPRLLWAVAAILLAAAVVAGGTAAGFLGLAICGGALLAVSPQLLGLRTARAVRTARITALAATAFFAAFILIAVAAPHALPAAIARPVASALIGTTFETRIEMWRAAARVLASRPLLGTGPDTFHLSAQPFLSGRLFELEYAGGLGAVPPDPHSVIALVGVSFGLAGLITSAMLGAAWLRAALGPREAEAAPVSTLRRAVLAGTLAALGVLLATPWAIVTGGFVFVCAGLAVAPAGKPRAYADERSDRPAKVRESHGALRSAVRAIAACGAIVLVVLAMLLLGGTTAFDRALRAPDAVSAAEAFDQAARLMPTYPYPRIRSLHAVGSQLGPSPEALAEWQARVDAEPAVHEDATAALYLVRVALDQAYRWGRTDVGWEEALIDEAARRFPNAPDVALERAHLACVVGDAEGARRALARLEGAPTRDTRYALYRYYLAVLDGDQALAASLRTDLEAEYGPLALLAPQ